MNKVKSFFSRTIIDGLSYMALGLFSTLIVGLIIETLGHTLNTYFDTSVMIEIGKLAQKMTGAGVGVAVSYGLGASPLVIFTTAVTGMYGYEQGGAVGSYLASVFASEIGRIYSGKTKIDIILSPILTLLVGTCIAIFVAPFIDALMKALGSWIQISTEQQPIIMGMFVSGLVGLTLSSPVSSAALALMLGLSGTAAAAATIGGCCHMVGFAVTSYKDNGISGVIAHGIGTSKLQIPNYLKQPFILIPPVVASIVVAPIMTVFWPMENNAAGAGMGPSGFVGQIMTIKTMGSSTEVWLQILFFHFLLPAVVCLFVYSILKKYHVIKDGQQTLMIGSVKK
ncbi:PTS transporter subunit IIC [Mammaliicoccus stepanovicii]|uniref:PTS system transporter subunit IIC n=1 Tax=Mammaliicoccus stepanovicii TaxID=643214 RepID=A0A239YYU5_9STAP|nr:PTS sugar transporter subunit IIC [Mammaliicoccus stepanovicii]PNZ72487.1 PTS sugar transporter subunit IIC [Mammaliicoccus stepanovicii]GGI40445.1 PTS sugar transporter subunit IID [Mammaliicoccus stepanovicii]SNV64095.1 PTS system transporter subunit IIC [Mammaliicoccus stepanovicii]